jgi:hypothetical protein
MTVAEMNHRLTPTALDRQRQLAGESETHKTVWLHRYLDFAKFFS